PVRNALRVAMGCGRPGRRHAGGSPAVRGGAIFDVRVVPEADGAMSLRSASLRWAAVYLSLLTCGIGFAIAALPARRSLPDRMSETRCV
ncbi:MAG: hypothetical protein ACLGH0_10320, partial [Thermoanaerobaculia bacterium]